MSSDPWTSDIRIVPAPRRVDDIGCTLRSAFSEPMRLPDAWVKLLSRLDGRTNRK
ncbi:MULTISPECIES: hypothetical protein [Sphingomonas]|uniref:Uncharacterized protein n=2 Tax=Sphingomonas paucimobilis TaxID=13689 RepID=A0A7T3A9S7_SPHPI|nr:MULTISPECIES: hypothetical protein [Sphingomonas]MBQ1479436.1 hypothetical protein [Sphingomonas sp.]QPT08452.1 hypothetical protein I6G38_17315 [Sphingomonas paucimobilis]QRY96396.1 hypothetical protein JT366_03735 [Sphingomonas paucimobilis]